MGIASRFPFLETRPINARGGIGAETDLKKVYDINSSGISMIDFTDTIKVIALWDMPSYSRFNVQTRQINSDGTIGASFISSQYPANILPMSVSYYYGSSSAPYPLCFLHGKNLLVFFGFSSLKKITASTLAIADDGTLGSNWINQNISSESYSFFSQAPGSYSFPVFAARVSDSIFAVIVNWQDPSNSGASKGYLFTYNISAGGIITPDYVDAREISANKIYDYVLFQVHPGIFAISYYSDPYGDCKLETWKIGDDGTIGASPIDTLVLGSYGSRVDDLVKVSNDIFAFSLENFENILNPIDPIGMSIDSNTITVPASIMAGYLSQYGVFGFDVNVAVDGSVRFESADDMHGVSINTVYSNGSGSWHYGGACFIWPQLYEAGVHITILNSQLSTAIYSNFKLISLTGQYIKTIRISPTGVIGGILDSAQLPFNTGGPVYEGPIYLNYRKRGG